MKERLLFESGTHEDYELEAIFLDDLMQEIADKFEPSFLVGTVGRWNGNFDGYRYLEEVQELRHAISNYDNIRIIQTGSRLYFMLYHHDGVHYMELRRLTDYGFNNRHKYCLESYNSATLDFIKRYAKNFGKVC